jgi:hypothetical protein
MFLMFLMNITFLMFLYISYVSYVKHKNQKTQKTHQNDMRRHARFQRETLQKWRPMHIKHQQLLPHKGHVCEYVCLCLYVCMSVCVCGQLCEASSTCPPHSYLSNCYHHHDANRVPGGDQNIGAILTHHTTHKKHIGKTHKTHQKHYFCHLHIRFIGFT